MAVVFSADQWSDSEFDENSELQTSHVNFLCSFSSSVSFVSHVAPLKDAKQTSTKEGTFKNLPFDEALDLSTSDASISRGSPDARGGASKAEVP